MHQIIDEASLNKYPILRHLVSMDLPNESFRAASLVARYDITIKNLGRGTYSLLELCCMLGKMEHLKAIWPEDVGVFRERWYESAIQCAAEYGHIITLQYLGSILTTEELNKAVKSDNYYPIRHAAKNGYIETLKYLEGYLTPEEQKVSVKTGDYWAIQNAVLYNQLATLQYLESHLTLEEREEAVKIDHYNAIRNAALSGDLATLQHLESHLTIDERKEAVKADGYRAIRSPAANRHLAMLHHLLNTDIALAYMESHDAEYGEQYVYPYVSARIDTLRAMKIQYEQANPQGVFDVGNEEARQGFYLLRNLIRRGAARDRRLAEDHLESLRFLLSIPSVRVLCHQCLNPDVGGQENELLRLALRIGNAAAAGMLMQVPEVRRLAVQNNFYRSEALGSLDLNQVARNTESSMMALSPPEEAALAAAKQHYSAAISERGGDRAVFDDLIETLQKHYAAHPATFDKRNPDGSLTALRLPLDWPDFQHLVTEQQLSADEQRIALEAYYQNPAHTAFRYLSKPNHWMAENAGYVNQYATETGELTSYRYSTFEEYIPLISLLFTSAFDEQTPAVDGYTLEGRQALFIRELALIGRAHNWDGYRENSKTHKREQYDDLQGDKPSCYSGVNRRLFQSVLGHPLFKQLNADLIKQCVNEHLRECFKTKITAENVGAIHKANLALISYDDDSEDAEKTLKSLNLTPEELEQIISHVMAQLEREFPQPFAANPSLWKQCIQDHLTQSKNSTIDFIAFNGIARLSSLVEDIARSTCAPPSRVGMFANSLDEAPEAISTHKPGAT